MTNIGLLNNLHDEKNTIVCIVAFYWFLPVLCLFAGYRLWVCSIAIYTIGIGFGGDSNFYQI